MIQWILAIWSLVPLPFLKPSWTSGRSQFTYYWILAWRILSITLLSKGDQSWVFIGRTDVEAETPILWPPDVKSWLIGKDPDTGKVWGQEEKGTTEDEMVGWHHWLDGRESEWTPGVGDGQGGLACCGSWGHKESHNWATELNQTEHVYICTHTYTHLQDLYLRNW